MSDRDGPLRNARFLLLTMSCVFAMLAAGKLAGDDLVPTADEVKAAFLYNFAKFVEWPESTFPSPSAPIRICIVGNTRLNPELEQTTTGKSIGTHPVETRRVLHPSDAAGCHILFFGASDGRVRSLNSAHSDGVLTVGESQDFLRVGGIINFVNDHQRVRFEVNLQSAEKAGLRISARLSQVARLVEH